MARVTAQPWCRRERPRQQETAHRTRSTRPSVRLLARATVRAVWPLRADGANDHSSTRFAIISSTYARSLATLYIVLPRMTCRPLALATSSTPG
jgi:hypothetical protein